MGKHRKDPKTFGSRIKAARTQSLQGSRNGTSTNSEFEDLACPPIEFWAGDFRHRDLNMLSLGPLVFPSTMSLLIFLETVRCATTDFEDAAFETRWTVQDNLDLGLDLP